MKKIYLLASFVMILFSNGQSYAQSTVLKEVLLTTLNNVNELKFSNAQIEGLMNYNKGFVDKVYVILDSDKEDKDKKNSLKTLNDQKEEDLRNLLGKSEAKKYIKLMEEELKPLIKKDKDLKNLV
jgi:hypothetical protein